MQRFVEEIYNKYRWDLDGFGFDPLSADDTVRDSYVYAWFTLTTPKKHFYIGKGKKNRYKHVLKEIEELETHPRRYKGLQYKMLQDIFGIDVEFLYKDLTAREAIILEAYCILQYALKKEPLLNTILPAGAMTDEIEAFRDRYIYSGDEAFLDIYR